MPREIRLNAFDMNCVGHIQQGLWTHPRDQSTRYTDIHYWTGLAQTLEAGLFDGVFFADVLGAYDVYGGRVDATLRGAVQLPVNDPSLIIPAMAAATRHLGFGVTCNLTYEPPFSFARRMSTLDHLTGGRIGWNIVTGYLDSAARASGPVRADGARRPLRPGGRIHVAGLQVLEGSCGRRRGARRPRRPRAMRIPPRSIACCMTAASTRWMPCTCASPRRNARRCCTRPALPRAAASSPRRARNAYS